MPRGLSLFAIIQVLFQLYYFTLFARIILSWIRIDPYHPIARFIHDMTEPVMRPFRNVLPPVGGLDLSPILVFVVFNFVQRIVLQTLWGLGIR